MMVLIWRRKRDLTCAAAQAASRLWSATGTPFTTARVQILHQNKNTALTGGVLILAEKEGFEPPHGY